MDFEVKTDDLKKVISCASRATSNKAIQPILNNILLCGEGKSLKVRATDLDLSIECKLPAEIKEAGEITLPAKKLEEIITKVSGQEISFTLDKNQLTKIMSNKSKFQINGVSSEDFPNQAKIEKKGLTVIEINQEELAKAISLTSFATSKFDTTSVLSGINFEVKKGKFELGATDGSRLARFIGKIENKEENIKVVIPFRAFIELEKLISTFKEGNEKVEIIFGVGQIIFQNNDFTMSTRLIDGKFPAYDNLIPKEQNNIATFDKKEFLSALERVAILANERTSVVKLSLGKKKKIAEISADSPDYGNSKDEIDVDYVGEEIEISFNYKYIAEALRNLDSGMVRLELGNSLSPLLLKTEAKTEYDYTYLVMPVQMR